MFQWTCLHFVDTGFHRCYQDASLHRPAGSYKLIFARIALRCSKYIPFSHKTLYIKKQTQVSVFTLFTLGSCLVTACNPLILELAVVIPPFSSSFSSSSPSLFFPTSFCPAFWIVIWPYSLPHRWKFATLQVKSCQGVGSFLGNSISIMNQSYVKMPLDIEYQSCCF